ncbi:MAG: hypothetical protein J6T10_20605 [Methanobrevibacter sp.]|nr:hypothetical protein [Methanobrevibacter sp.]
MLREDIVNEIKHINDSYIFNLMRLSYKLGFNDATNNYYQSDRDIESEIREFINQWGEPKC